MKIRSAKAFKVFNSNAEPAIAVAIKTKKGIFISAAPSGASVGKKEVKQFKTSLTADIKYFNSKTASMLRGFKLSKFEDFEKLEHNLTPGNPLIALEYAMLKGLAVSEQKPIYKLLTPKLKFPKLLGKAIGGGAHAGIGDIQEYLFSPQADSLTKNAEINADIHHYIKEKLTKLDKHFQGGRGAEGGWLTALSVTEILKLCNDAIRYASTKFKCEIELGIDLAASQLYRNKKYYWTNFSPQKRRRVLNKSAHEKLLVDLIRDYNLTYVEDPFEENDFSSFASLANLTPRRKICADDLTCTNLSILERVIKNRTATAVIVKPNQIGSLIKTAEFVSLARKFGLTTVVSHRSGSFADPVLSHLAIAWGDYFKCGTAGGERVGKINELIRLERASEF